MLRADEAAERVPVEGGLSVADDEGRGEEGGFERGCAAGDCGRIGGRERLARLVFDDAKGGGK